MSTERILEVILRILCGISVLTCLIVIFIYLKATPLRNPAFKIIFWLNVCNLLKFLTLMMPSSINEFSSVFCELVAYIFYSSSFSGVLLTTLIAYRVYKSVIFNEPEPESGRNFILIIIFIISFCVCSLPLFFGLYGPETGSCLLKTSILGGIFRLAIYYIPALGFSVYCNIVYIKVIRKLKEDELNNQRDLLKLRYFPLILVLCFTPELLVRFIQYFGFFNYGIYFIGSFLMRLQGLFDALAYSFTPPVKLYIKLLWRKRSKININQSDLFEPN